VVARLTDVPTGRRRVQQGAPGVLPLGHSPDGSQPARPLRWHDWAARVGAPSAVLGGRGRMTGTARDRMPAEWGGGRTRPAEMGESHSHGRLVPGTTAPTAHDRTAVHRRAASGRQ
jgi:hypothetical protein